MERLEQGLGYEWPRIAYQVFLTPVFYVVIRWLALTRERPRAAATPWRGSSGRRFPRRRSD
jgi:hypothetical protein